jgi:hypothetical protein
MTTCTHRDIHSLHNVPASFRSVHAVLQRRAAVMVIIRLYMSQIVRDSDTRLIHVRLTVGTAITIYDRASAANSPPSLIRNASLIYAARCLRLKGSFATDSNAFKNSSSSVRFKMQHKQQQHDSWN